MDFENYLKQKHQRSRSRTQQQLPPMQPNPHMKERFEKYLLGSDQDQQMQLSEIVGSPAKRNMMSRNKNDLFAPKSKMSGGLEQGLTSSLLKRVTHLEKTLKAYRIELQERTQQKIVLQDQVDFYEEHFNPEDQITVSKIFKENKLLQAEISYIQDFLEGYGLQWKGFEVEGKLDIEELTQNTVENNPKLRFRNNLPKSVDIHVLDARVQDLNAIILKETGLVEIVRDKHGISSFKEKKPVNVVFF